MHILIYKNDLNFKGIHVCASVAETLLQEKYGQIENKQLGCESFLHEYVHK